MDSIATMQHFPACILEPGEWLNNADTLATASYNRVCVCVKDAAYLNNKFISSRSGLRYVVRDISKYVYLLRH
jgi:hypothetical protein